MDGRVQIIQVNLRNQIFEKEAQSEACTTCVRFDIWVFCQPIKLDYIFKKAGYSPIFHLDSEEGTRLSCVFNQAPQSGIK